MNIFKPSECNGCVHEYSLVNCPCCGECEVKKKNPERFIDSTLTQSENIKDFWLLLLVSMIFSDEFKKRAKELEEKHNEIKEKRRSEEIGKILERNPYF